MNDLFLAAGAAIVLTWVIGRFLSRPNEEIRRRIKKVSGEEARQLKERGVPFLAVFSVAEFNQAHIPGSLNIPVQELGGRLAELAHVEEVVVYCASGMRSARAARVLADSGKQVYDLGPMGAF